MWKTANRPGPRARTRALLMLAAAALLPGCGWVPALVGSLAATGDDDDPPAREPVAPGPETLARGASPLLVLEDEPAGIAIGRFLPDAAGGFHDLGAAVIFKEERRVAFYRGDGTGRFAEGATAIVSGESVAALAAVPAPPGTPWGLLVVTKNTLEWIQWNGGLRMALIPLEGEADQRRNLAVGDFDGDGRPDAAVSSHLNGWVEFVKVPWAGQPFEPLRPPLVLAGQHPCDVAAGDFFPDETRRSDLAVLIENLGCVAIFASRPEENAVFCRVEDARTTAFPDPAPSLAKRADLPCDEQGNLSAAEAAGAPVPYDLNGDGGCDLAYIRDGGTGTILVTRPVSNKDLPADPACLPPCGADEGTCNWHWKLDVQNRGGGHLSPEAAGLVLLRLPDPDPTFKQRAAYGRATADAFLRAIIVSYFVANGKDFASTLSYPLPGPGLDLAAGDLDGNGWPDLVAVSGEAGRYFLSAFLAEDPGADPGDLDVLSHPFRVPFAATAGETPRNAASPMDVAFGHAGPGQADPFLAAVDNVNKEAVVWFLDLGSDGRPAPLRRERYSGLGGRPWGLQVRDLDGDGCDDICVSAYDRFHFLKSRGAGTPRFAAAEYPFLDLLRQDPAIAQKIENPDDPDYDPDYLKNNFRDLKLRNFPTAGPLDGNPAADLVIPFTSKGLNGLLVVRNGFDAGQVRFHALYIPPIESPDQPTVPPNQVALANLDGDGAIDLVIACDDEPHGALLMLGDPAEPGTFLSDTTVLISPIADPLRRYGFEWATTDNAAHARGATPDGWPIARWIAVTTDYYAVVFFNSLDASPGRPDFASIPPRIVYVGEDPESITASDFFRSDGLSLDLAIVDENRDAVIFLTWDDARDDWFEQPFTLPARLPQHLVPFDLGGSRFLALAGRAQQSLEVFQRQGDCPGSSCAWQYICTFPLPPEDRAGRPAGVSIARSAAGAVQVALAVEDGDAALGADAPLLVDLVSVAGPSPDMAGLGSFRSTAVERVAVENCENELGLAGVLLVDIDRDGEPDLLTFEPETLRISRAGAPGRMAATIIELPVLPGGAAETLVRWSAPAQRPDLTWIALCTNRRACLIGADRLSGARLEWVCEAPRGAVHDAAVGWRNKGRNPRTDLFLALMDASGISIVLPAAGEPAEPPVLEIDGAFRMACLGARDVNRDGIDDLAVVDGMELRIHLASTSGAGGPFRAEPSRVAPLPRFVDPVEVAFLEANGDGWTDIACGTRDGDVLVFLGNGRGAFGSPATLVAAPGVEALRAADLDGDGIDEILAAVDTPGLVILPGAGTMQPQS